MTILALDPSTDKTGVALLTFDEATGVVSEVESVEIDATARHGDVSSLVARLGRIRFTRSELSGWVRGLGAIDLIAYERDTGRGHAASEALVMAAGNYLTLSVFGGTPILPVSRQAACKATGTLGVYREPKGATATEQKVKRARLKAAVIGAVNERCGLALTPEQDAEADAIAVGLGAIDVLVARRKKAPAREDQKALKSRRSPAKKASAAQ